MAAANKDKLKHILNSTLKNERPMSQSPNRRWRCERNRRKSTVLPSANVATDTYPAPVKPHIVQGFCTPTLINTHQSTHARFSSSLTATAGSLNGDSSETASPVKCPSQDNDWTPVTPRSFEKAAKSLSQMFHLHHISECLFTFGHRQSHLKTVKNLLLLQELGPGLL